MTADLPAAWRVARGPARRHRRPCRRSACRRSSAAAARRRRPDHAPVRGSVGKPTGCRGRRPGHGFLCSTRLGCGRLPDRHLFLGAPALCWWARTMVLSIIAYSLSASLARCSNTCCHTPLLGPAAEPAVGVLPVAKAFRQVAPRNSGAVAIEHRFDESAVVLSGDADIARLRPAASPLSAPTGHRAVHIGSWVSLF